ncbi:hypothetical protein NMY22_g14199 [Coprinellus aureogranulatus]|nr:hypothetical protein NMY22_g14199 [Coprinellus aureogranulatus]
MDDALELPSAAAQKPAENFAGDNDQDASEDEDGGLDWTKLLPAAMRPVIPKRGEKEFEPRAGGSSLQAHILDRSRAAMFETLKATRTTSSAPLIGSGNVRNPVSRPKRSTISSLAPRWWTVLHRSRRFGLANVSTPAILSSEEFDSSPVALLLTVSSYVIVPILAQRLLLNMQKVDHVGSQPFASRLLFASTAFERESSTQGAVDDSIEMGSPVSLRHREARSAKEEVSEIDRDRP